MSNSINPSHPHPPPSAPSNFLYPFWEDWISVGTERKLSGSTILSNKTHPFLVSHIFSHLFSIPLLFTPTKRILKEKIRENVEGSKILGVQSHMKKIIIMDWGEKPQVYGYSQKICHRPTHQDFSSSDLFSSWVSFPNVWFW